VILPGAALYAGALRIAGDRIAGLPGALIFGPGLSIAFWPLLLLYLTIAGLSLGWWLATAIIVVAAAVLVGLWIPAFRLARLSTEQIAIGLSLVGLSVLALAFRLRDIQGLPVPMFGDSLHHTMITTIIANTGRVPSGYQPFVPVDTFTYHFGFHTLAALLASITGATPPDAVLIMGQVLIVFAIPAAYLLARVLFDSRPAGLFAAVLTGFASAMPAYYVNWGRYTQLAGQVLLPAGLALLWLAAQPLPPEQRGIRIAHWALAAFCVAGLVVVHYRILIFYGLFGIALAAGQLVRGWPNWRAMLRIWLLELGIVIAGLLAAAPWLANLLANYVPGLFGRLRTVTTEYIAAYNSLDNFRYFVGLALAAAGLLGVGLAVFTLVTRRGKSSAEMEQADEAGLRLSPEASALIMAGWAVLMVLSIAWPPGAIGSYTVAISLYIPLTALGGYGIARLLELLPARTLRAAWVTPVLALLAAPVLAIGFGTWHLSDPGQFSYVHPADLQAFDWIRANTEPDSKFLISSEFSYAGRGVTASDAGMWLPLLTGRNVSVPALSSWTEHPFVPDFFTETRTLAAYTQPRTDLEVQRLAATGAIPAPLDPGDPQALALMKKLGITHIYSGTAEGTASKPRFDLAALRRENCRFKLLYTAPGGVYVFQIQYGATCK